MKRVLRWVCCAALCVLALSEAGWANDKKEGQTFTQKQPENYYLAGAVPEVNGKVVFRRELELPGWSQDQIFDKVKEWLVRSEQQDQDIILNRNIVREDKAKGEIYVQNQEYLVFVDRGLSLDRADFSFLQRYICSPGKCVLEVSRLKYVYDNETHMAEGWISDDYALDKNKTKVYPGVRRQRIKTVDRVDELFAGLTGSFMVLQLAQTPVQAGMTGAPSVMFPASQTAPVQSGQVPAAPAATVPAPAPVEGAVATAPAVVPPAVPEKKGHWVAETPLPLPETQTEPAGLADTQTGEGTALPGYKRIAPQQIPGNIIKMLNDNPNVTIELGAHTDRKGTDQYNERLAQRRAQSVVDYLIAGGIEAARLEAKGYGESVPKTINKKMAKQFDFLKEGDVLTEEFILALPPEQQEIADQINRRTEFKVLRTNYNLF